MSDTRHKDGANLTRRRVLALAGTAGAWALIHPWRRATAQPTPACTLTPAQMEGPYFRDVKRERSDLRTDPSGAPAVEGAALALTLRALDASDGCRPLAGAVVELWQCDAFGRYSDVRDVHAGFDTRGQTFLRGYQVTDDDGAVRFLTIYPGWYPGRTVHIHFKIRTDPDSAFGQEFTSQLYFDDALTDRVHAQAPYAQRGRRTVRNDRDGLFRDGGERLVLRLGETAGMLAGTFEVGLVGA